jgi:hypothetical protein
MADSQTLTDEQLIAVAQSGDSSLLRALTPQEKSRMVTLAQQAPPDLAASRDRLSRANATPLQEPTTFLGGAIRGFRGEKDYAPVTAGDVVNDPTEALSRTGAIIRRDVTDPRLLAGLAASYVVPKMVDALPAVGDAVIEPARATAGAMLKKATGVDPASVEKQIARTDLQATRMRLQAAKSRTRVATYERKQAEAAAAPPPRTTAAEQPLILTPEQLQMHQQQMANAGLLAREQGMKSAAYGRAAWDQPQAAPTPASIAPSAAATSPAETSRAAAPPAAPPSVALPRAAGKIVQQLQAEGYSAAEVQQAAQWLQEGVSPQNVVGRIEAARALQQRPSFGAGTSPEQAANRLRGRQQAGRWSDE